MLGPKTGAAAKEMAVSMVGTGPPIAFVSGLGSNPPAGIRAGERGAARAPSSLSENGGGE